jgi:hypothetical protein
VRPNAPSALFRIKSRLLIVVLMANGLVIISYKKRN